MKTPSHSLGVKKVILNYNYTVEKSFTPMSDKCNGIISVRLTLYFFFVIYHLSQNISMNKFFLFPGEYFLTSYSSGW